MSCPLRCSQIRFPPTVGSFDLECELGNFACAAEPRDGRERLSERITQLFDFRILFVDRSAATWPARRQQHLRQDEDIHSDELNKSYSAPARPTFCSTPQCLR